MDRGASYREVALKRRFGPDWPPKMPGPGWPAEPSDPFAEFREAPRKPKRARSGYGPHLSPHAARVARVYRPPNTRRTSPLMTVARVILAALVILLITSTVVPLL
ncbi:MAG TPA: hypothetical protein VHY31_09905 [Streptosporangiaceae bacterium]|nr:hypothetical protein [Streptosporangiaceae bacterium]